MMNLYGLTLAIAIFISYSFTAYRAKKRGLSTQIVWDSLPWVLVFGILGARIYHVLNYWGYYSQNLILIPQVWLGGLGILGGLGGGLVGLLLYFKRSYPSRHSEVSVPKNPSTGSGQVLDPSLRIAQDDEGKILNYLDAAAPAIVLGQALGRVGNVFNSENLPYAYWEMMANLTIFLFLILVERFVNYKSQVPNSPRFAGEAGHKQTPNSKFQTQNGYLFFLYLFSYSLFRFLLEFFRTDSPWIWGLLTVAQWVCLFVLLSITTTLVLRRLLRHYVVTK